jgi:hypothetical protein
LRFKRLPVFAGSLFFLELDMRPLIVVTLAALGLAACGSDEQANNTVNIDQAVMADDLAANDVTAIDAVTGDAANMAADVDINFTNDMLESAGSNASGGTRSGAPRSRPRTAAPGPATGNTATPAAEPATNAATNVTE